MVAMELHTVDDIELNGEYAAAVAPGGARAAAVLLQVVHDAVAGWVGVAPPLSSVPLEPMAAAHDHRPKTLLVAEHDQFCEPATAAEITRGWAATEVLAVQGADHFLAGRLDWVTTAVTRALLGD